MISFAMSGLNSVYSVYNHLTLDSEQRAKNLGFPDTYKTAEQTRQLKDTILPTRYSAQPSTETRIRLFREYAGYNEADGSFSAEFTAANVINTVVQQKYGKEIRWLDIAAQAKDPGFAAFLMENGADLDLCDAQTKTDLNAVAETIIGFQSIPALNKTAEETKALRNQILPPAYYNQPVPSTETRIGLFREYAGYNEADGSFSAEFTAANVINTVVQQKDEKQIRWLDIAAQAKDPGFAAFLMENGADLDLCDAQTKTDLNAVTETVGFQPVNDKTAEETKAVVQSIREARTSKERITLLKEFGGYRSDTASGHNNHSPIHNHAFPLDLPRHTEQQLGHRPNVAADIHSANTEFANIHGGFDNGTFSQENTHRLELSQENTRRFRLRNQTTHQPIYSRHNDGRFPLPFGINSPIRIYGPIQDSWLSLGVALEDRVFVEFLRSNNALANDLSAETETKLNALMAPMTFRSVGQQSPQDIEKWIQRISDAESLDTRRTILENLTELHFDFDAYIFEKNGESYKFLDFMAELNDPDSASFLLEHGANTTPCLNQTRQKFNDIITTFEEQQRQREQQRLAEINRLEPIIRETTLEQQEAIRIQNERIAALRQQLEQLQRQRTPIPHQAGDPTDSAQVTNNINAASNRNLGLYMSRVIVCAPLIVAGGCLYATPMVFNGLISTAYITAQAFASIGALPAYAVDKAIWGGINIARTALGYEKADTRYYLTKTIGGAACVTALLGVAIFTNNLVSIGLRRVFLSGPADLGARLISWSFEGCQSDTTAYENMLKNLHAHFETSQPDMQWKNWERIITFTGKLATHRGFKENYKNTFTIRAENPHTQEMSRTPNPSYPGFVRGTLASFAMRIYP